MNGINSLIKETQESSLLPPRHVRTRGEVSSLQPSPKHSPHQNPTMLGLSVFRLPASRTVTNKCMLFTSHPVYRGLLQQPKQTKTAY